MSKKRVPARAVRTRAEAVPGPPDPKRLGEVINDRMLCRMRQVDVASGQSDAERARRMNTSRQQVEHLHKDVKVVTLSTMIQWCASHDLRPEDEIRDLWTDAVRRSHT